MSRIIAPRRRETTATESGIEEKLIKLQSAMLCSSNTAGESADDAKVDLPGVGELHATKRSKIRAIIDPPYARQIPNPPATERIYLFEPERQAWWKSAIAGFARWLAVISAMVIAMLIVIAIFPYAQPDIATWMHRIMPTQHHASVPVR